MFLRKLSLESTVSTLLSRWMRPASQPTQAQTLEAAAGRGGGGGESNWVRRRRLH